MKTERWIENLAGAQLVDATTFSTCLSRHLIACLLTAVQAVGPGRIHFTFVFSAAIVLSVVISWVSVRFLCRQ